MKPSAPSSAQPSQSRQQKSPPLHQKLKPWLFAVIAISLIGFIDATYLTVLHLDGETPKCKLIEGCDVVTTSSYAEVFGIPVALFGALGYLSILLLALHYQDSRWLVELRLISFLSFVALLASAWFVYLQAFVIGAWCQYCLLSATTSILLFLIGVRLYILSKD